MSSLNSQAIRGGIGGTDRLDRFIRRIDQLEYGSLELRVAGRSYLLNGHHPGPAASIEIHKFGSLARRLMFNGDLGLAEAYINADWDTPNLTDLLVLLAQNRHRLTKTENPSLLGRLARRLYHWSRRNSLAGSARNITAHYDLGNAFYAQWLDWGMTYSSGIFTEDGEGLESAQANKYQRILDLLDAKPGDRILEIGCGWGGFAVTAASKGMTVEGITLSPAQLAWAQRRVEALDLTDRVNLSLTDYRQLYGSYDHIVSIEMFEAVGEAYWSDYMDTLKANLKPGGRAALQVITIDDLQFESYRRTPDFIQRYIFPGGMLPADRHLRSLPQAAGLHVIRDDRFGLDYAKTLHLWQRNFEQSWETVQALGFDERFRRMWRYYLSYCEAGFKTGTIDLHQVLLTNPD